MHKIIINTEIITLNEYIRQERTNRYKAAVIKKQQTSKIEYLCRLKHNRCKIERKNDVLFRWFTPNNRIDHDNIAFGAKFIFDGFKKAGVIIDDSPKYIGNIHHTFTLDRDRSYISCIVEFYEKIGLCLK